MLHIIDVSAYQGTTVPAVDAVFVKATEGSSYTSSKFKAQYASAKQRAKHRGAYHFARPEQSSARAQADRFLDVVQPVIGESVWLDLEASDLSQAKTHAWAEAWAARVGDQVPGITYGIYLGSGYASNNTGKDLAEVYPLWWYPQYPGAYQLRGVDPEEVRARNRSHDLGPARLPIAAKTTRWPPEVTPWLPTGLTFGKAMPDIWQFTDNWNGMDASVSALTLDQLAGGGQNPLEDDMAYGGQIPAGKGSQINVSFPKGSMKAVGFVIDNSVAIDGVIAPEPQAQVRYAFHRKTGSWQTGTATVGSADGGADHSPKTVVSLTSASDVDYASFVRLDDGTRPVGWDMS